MSARLHRIHAAPSPKGNRVDIGSTAWRGEGSPWPVKREQARRIAVCWNVCEGWPTEALEAGALRDVDEFTRRLLDVIAGSCGPYPPGVLSAVADLVDALAKRDAQQDVSNGRLHDCEACLASAAGGQTGGQDPAAGHQNPAK